jgi:hypothetical protein
MSKVVKSYKGFNKDMTCRGFQYKEGKEYETSKAVVCNEGFHACEYPLDCLGYYSPNTSVYHEVEQTGEFSSGSDNRDSKIASTKIKIGAKLSIAGLVQAAIDFTKSKTVTMQNATGDYGASSATGYKGASSATGYKGASSVENTTGVAVAWGYLSKAKGCIGSHIVCAEWRYVSNKKGWEFVGAKMTRVDGDKIKAGVYYTLKDGEFVAAVDTEE